MMRRYLVVVGLLPYLVNLACKSDRCETKLDCPSGQECNDGVCEPIRGGCPNPPCSVIPPRDAGVDAGFDNDGGPNDGGPNDGGPNDGGPNDGGPNDGGPNDGGPDGGPNDGGPNDQDGGPIDGGDAGPPQPIPAGDVRLSEFNAGATIVVEGYAEFLDRTTATYESVSEEYAPANASCILSRVTLISGMPTGYEVDEVTVGLNNGRSITYESVGNGRYEPASAPLPGVFDGATMVDFAIVSNGMNGTLDDAAATMSAPIGIASPVPPAGMPIASPYSLLWNGMGMPTDGRRTIVELYDSGKEVRLSCRLVSDLGTFTFPNDALQDFAAENPTPPLTVELRYEYLTIMQVPIIGSSNNLPVAFRTIHGVRWPAQ